MATEMRVKCSRRIYNGRGFSSACTRNGRVEREGKWYCGQHDPVAVAQRREALLEEWERQRRSEAQRAAEVAEQKRRADAYPRLLAAPKALVEPYGGTPDEAMRKQKRGMEAAKVLIAEVEGSDGKAASLTPAACRTAVPVVG